MAKVVRQNVAHLKQGMALQDVLILIIMDVTMRAGVNVTVPPAVLATKPNHVPAKAPVSGNGMGLP